VVDEHADEASSRSADAGAPQAAAPSDGGDEHAEIRTALDDVEGALDGAAATIARMT